MHTNPTGSPTYGHSAESPETAAALERLMDHTLAWLDEPEEEGPASVLRVGRGAGFGPKSLGDLQWEQLVAELVRETRTPEGAELMARLSPIPARELVGWRLGEVGEFLELLETDDAPPLGGLRDIRRALGHAVREGVLVAEDLEAIARNSDVASRCQRYFANRRERAPRLTRVGMLLEPLRDLRAVLDHAVEPGGRLADQASPDLGRLRRAVQNQHDRLKSRMDQMLRSSEYEVHLQDDYYTVRDERYVLPIRAGARSAVGGIVHGHSASGQTAYIEPAELIELNNQLQWAQLEVHAEEQRILERLTRMVAQAAPALEQNTRVLAYLDVVHACARFSRRIQARIPQISDGELDLRQVRHPLLFLKFARVVDGRPVNLTVANDIRLDAQQRVLIISGPNTGGKTVLLKTLGLCALMIRCGLPLPVDEDSCIPLYDSVFTDIGDEQSIERDLSTFSGHLVNIKGFLPGSGAHTLVLLDELFSGTDPMQGAALAVALLEDLAQRGATTAVTTHLEGLKTLAYQSAWFANASMGFDLATLTPTYQMTMGLPGSSFAVRIAERLGFPQKLVERARQVLEGQDHATVEEVLAGLEDQMGELRAEQQRLRHARLEAERVQQKFKDKYQALLNQEREQLYAETRKLREQLREARDVVREKVREAQATGGSASEQAFQKIREELRGAEDVLERVHDASRPVEAGPKGMVRVGPEEIEVGLRVYAHTFKREGVVLSGVPGQSQALVQIGNLKAMVDVDRLYFVSEADRRASVRARPTRPEPVVEVRSAPMLLPQTSDNTCDVRGLRADEALEKLDLFLDAAYLNNIEGAYVIHGHGTGALKRAVRGHLPQSRYVDQFRRGEREEGGDGVTVVFLKES